MMKKVKKRNKIIISSIVTIVLTISIASWYFIKFNNTDPNMKYQDGHSYNENSPENIENSLKLDEKSKANYRKIGEKALGGAKESLNSKQKDSVRYEAIYQAIYNDKASKIMESLQISETEALNYINKTDNNILSKVVIFDNDEIVYILSNSSLSKLEDTKLKESYVGNKVKEIREPTNEERIEIAKREIASSLVVERIVKETNEVLSSGGSGEVK